MSDNAQPILQDPEIKYAIGSTDLVAHNASCACTASDSGSEVTLSHSTQFTGTLERKGGHRCIDHCVGAHARALANSIFFDSRQMNVQIVEPSWRNVKSEKMRMHYASFF